MSIINISYPFDEELTGLGIVSSFFIANDTCCWVLNAIPKYSKSQVQNLKALCILLDESNQDNRLMIIEIARKLGGFDPWLRLLSQPLKEGKANVVGFIKKLFQENVYAAKFLQLSK